jgi:hypothetical protein
LGHFTTKTVASQALKLAGALAFVVALGGCGAVQMEGKVFDYMGVSGDRSQQADVQMSERPSLLVPPNVKTLPQPGPNAAVVTARQDWPDDPELVRKRVAKQEKAKEVEIHTADHRNAYNGKPNLLDKWLGGSDDEVAPIADVPEPDASDRQPATAVAQSGSKRKPLTPHVSQAPLPTQPVKRATPESYGGMSNPQGNSLDY